MSHSELFSQSNLQFFCEINNDVIILIGVTVGHSSGISLLFNLPTVNCGNVGRNIISDVIAINKY